MISEEKLQDLLSRLRMADHRSSVTYTAAILQHVRGNAIPTNQVLQRFEQERQSTWHDWPRQKIGGWYVWSFPDPDLCPSLAWHLFSTLAELDEWKGKNWLHEFYRNQHYNENTRAFLNNWLDFFVDALKQLIEADLAPTASGRRKQEKFAILDSPAMYPEDMKSSPGLLGRAVLFIDIDDFKSINTRYTEVTVDKAVLPKLHRELADCANGNGFAYAEGGDEYVVLLPNVSVTIAQAFAETLRARVRQLKFDPPIDAGMSITVSVGVAHQGPFEAVDDMRQRANNAKNVAKSRGKDQIATWSDALPVSSSNVSDVELRILASIIKVRAARLEPTAESISKDLGLDAGAVLEHMMEMHNKKHFITFLANEANPVSAETPFHVCTPAWEAVRIVPL